MSVLILDRWINKNYWHVIIIYRSFPKITKKPNSDEILIFSYYNWSSLTSYVHPTRV
ncbi:hypothetical protein C1646_686984 [Rhizophagus diaphanus]|nr:hypothetical protein C1646_686984 [Rhizophagus diaphanus] [Rhizophagus sp. MUCL 43196]